MVAGVGEAAAGAEEVGGDNNLLGDKLVGFVRLVARNGLVFMRHSKSIRYQEGC